MPPKKNKQVQAFDPATLDTYFKKRMYEIGITDTAAYGFKEESLEYAGTHTFFPLFAEKSNGSIQINYPCLYGGAEYIKGTENEFFRVRNHPDQMTDPSFKYYQQPKSGVHIFHTPGIIEKFVAKTKIPTLFLVEGEFKAFAGYQAGLDIVGLGGKDLFKDEEGDLHQDVQAIVRNCDVENLVLLLDADVFALNWDPEEDPNKDLARRLNSFYASVKNFRELAKGKVKDAYFSHIDEKYLNEAKGLDDLLQVKAFDRKEIIADLLKLTAARHFFKCKNLNGDNLNKIKEYFLLTYNKNVPAYFYGAFSEQIGELEFNFNGARFQKDKNEGLKLLKHVDSFKYVRVGCDYFKLVKVPNSKAILEERRTPWKKAEITMDYVQKGNANFFDTIDKYDAFCNVPDNTESYKRVINGCFNLYFPPQHEPTAGLWPNIEKYLKHVFGEKVISTVKTEAPDLFGGTQVTEKHTTNYDLALDCLQLKYLRPTQKLPILCLVSAERNTGKSTFLWLLREIYNENATVIGSQEINDQYNDDWAAKAIIGIDEGFIDKKVVLEKIKSQSTNDKIKLRGMYAGRQDVSFFGWFIMTSNDVLNFIPIEKEEIRFWVNKVQVFKEDDPHLLRKMTEEIPAFLHSLKHRQIIHQEKSRFWFAKELIETDALIAIKENSKGWFAQELKEIMIDKFFFYKYHTVYYTLTEIFELLNGPNSAVRFRKGDIRKQLQEKFNLVAINNRWQHPIEPGTPSLSPTVEKHARCYEFKVEDFLTEEEIRQQLGEYFDYDEVIRQRSEKIAAAKKPDDLPF